MSLRRVKSGLCGAADVEVTLRALSAPLETNHYPMETGKSTHDVRSYVT